ncbi:choloylglycine hydrolase family protein [Agrilactobacillus yilanensis]|uniref:Choloylglycine hydrolase family protein n=1 Tax=Agrilactobacillus yilanensis TaxID=2485997 RepID=A0ABW4J9I7_9LACO|nr:choloylglycine hydrolase family protein [Agrilactobacillus yilanensis]
MCTSLTYMAEKGAFFLARTMDFGIELGGSPVVVPRNQHFNSDATAEGYDTTYSFVGAGRDVGNYILVDGVNEKGLSAAALYFRGEATYAKTPMTGKTNLAPHEVVNWLLGNMASCAELGQQLTELNVLAIPIALLQVTTPLHWIIADVSGACYVLELDQTGCHYIANPVGVMANSPDFQWHLKNLSNYLQVQPTPHPHRTYGQFVAADFGPGSGALGLPGDFTSPSRFVRLTYMRQYAETAKTPEAAVNVLSHLLNTVDIPRGVKIKEDGSSDYTQYRGYMRMDQPTYYMQPYYDQTISRVILTENLMNQPAPIAFPLEKEQEFKSVNQSVNQHG